MYKNTILLYCEIFFTKLLLYCEFNCLLFNKYFKRHSFRYWSLVPISNQFHNKSCHYLEQLIAFKVLLYFTFFCFRIIIILQVLICFWLVITIKIKKVLINFYAKFMKIIIKIHFKKMQYKSIFKFENIGYFHE